MVVDDHTLFRNGLRILLDGIDGFSVIGEASNGVELLELLPTLHPDVILLDIEMPRMNGIQDGGRGFETLSGDENHHLVHVWG